MYNHDNKAAFAVLSSLMLELAAKSFPDAFLFTKENIVTKATAFGLAPLINKIDMHLTNTFTWLVDEAYLRQTSEKNKLLAVLTEKGAKSIDLVFSKPSEMFTCFSTHNSEYASLKGKAKNGFTADKELKLQGPAISFIHHPKNLLG